MKRRDFLTTAVLSAGAAAMPGLSQAAESTGKNRKVKYAVIGLGFFSNYVIPRIANSALSEVTALVSSDRDKALEWAKKYGVKESHIYNYDNLENIAQNPDIDAVYIATPVGTHADFAMRAFRAGKHVMTEKTMAAGVKQGLAMQKAAKAAGKKLMVAYRSRFEPFNQKAIEFAADKTYGKVNAIAAHKGFFIGDRLGKNNWRSKREYAWGGALVDIGVYSIQACRYIAGSEPSEVSAFAFSTENDSRFKEVEENLSFMLRFPDGLLATGSASWNYSLQNYYRVGATEANYGLEPATSNMNLRMTVNTMQPRVSAEHLMPNVDQIAAEFDHFSDCILNNKEPLTNGEEGIKDLKVIEALYKSVELNRPVRV